jgi:hypothetical protein
MLIHWLGIFPKRLALVDHAFCALNARNDEKKVHPILLL